MKAIGLTVFSLEFERMHEKLLLNDLDNRAFKFLFKDFLEYLKAELENDESIQKVLQVKNYEIIETKDKNTDEILYTTFQGRFKSGEYGLDSEILDPATNLVVFEKNSKYADVLPFYFCIGIPEKDSSRAVLILQSIGNYGIKTIFYKTLKKFIADVLNIQAVISMGALMPSQYLDLIMEKGRFNKVRLIKYQIPTDLSDKFGVDKGLTEKNSGYVETVIARGRNKHSQTIKAIAKKALSSFSSDTKVIQLQDLHGYEYDTIKVEVKIGNRTKTISARNLSNLNITEDITDDVKTNSGGHPEEESMLPILKLRLEEYFNLLGILGWCMNTIVLGILLIITFLMVILKFNKLSNVNIIIGDYLTFLLRDNKFKNLLFYVILPVLYGFYFAFYKIISIDVLNSIGLIFSVMTGVLFTFLSMLISVNERYCSTYRTSTRNIIIKDIFTVIMMEITVSISVLILTVLYLFIEANGPVLTALKYVSYFIYYSFVIFFLINFTIIVKRIFNLYKDIFNKI